jgi:hypothetical protein
MAKKELNPRYLGLAEILYYTGGLSELNMLERNCRLRRGKNPVDVVLALRAGEVDGGEDGHKVFEAIARRLVDVLEFV